MGHAAACRTGTAACAAREWFQPLTRMRALALWHRSGKRRSCEVWLASCSTAGSGCCQWPPRAGQPLPDIKYQAVIEAGVGCGFEWTFFSLWRSSDSPASGRAVSVTASLPLEHAVRPIPVDQHVKCDGPTTAGIQVPLPSRPMRLSTILLAFVLIGMKDASAAGEPTVWTGTLAGKQIVWRALDGPSSFEQYSVPAGTGATAQYFYRAHGKYITLKDRGDGWLLECMTTFSGTECDRPTGMWRLLSRNSREITAEWKASEFGPTAPVVLSPTNVRGEDAWQRLLGDGQRKTSSTIHKNGVGYSVLSDPRSGARVPLLVSGLSEDAMARFNELRRAELQRFSAARLDNQSYGGDESDESAVRYVSRRWMTWAGGGGGYYGGAHPIWAWSVVTYDLSTGKSFDARDIFRSSLNPEPGNVKNVTIDMKAVPNTLEGLVLRSAYALAMKWDGSKGRPADADCFDDWLAQLADCEMDDRDHPIVCTLRTNRVITRLEVAGLTPMLTHAGLAVVSNNTSEAARSCRGIMITIPWNEAKLVLAPGVVLP